MASHKVLILDGDSVVRSKLRRLLPPGSYEIAEASDGESGLALIHQERGRIRFILLNAALAKVSGWEVVAHLKADSDFRQIPIVVMRGSPRQDPDLSRPIYAAVEILDKPFERSQLKRAVKTAIKKAKALNSHQPANPTTLPDPITPDLAPELTLDPLTPPDSPPPALASDLTPEPVTSDLDPTHLLENAFEEHVDFGTERANPFAGLDDFMAAADPQESLDLPEEFQLSEDFDALPDDFEQPPFDPTSGFTQPFIRPQGTPSDASGLGMASGDPSMPMPYTRDRATPAHLEITPDDLVNSPSLSAEFSRGGDV